MLVGRFFLVVCVAFSGIVSAQKFELNGKDTINRVDELGKKQGYWILTNKIKRKPGYQPSEVVEEGKYVDSRKQGLWKSYFPGGNVKSEVTYKNNRPNGPAVIYHKNGEVSEKGIWKGNRWVGDYKLFYENGKVAQDFKFATNGKREGEQKYYYETGQLMIEGSWAQGKESGLVKEYYENGDLRSEKYFNGGTLDPAKTKTYEAKKVIVKKEEVPVTAPKVTVKQDEKPNLPTQVFNGEGEWTLYNKNRDISKKGFFRRSRLINGEVYQYNVDGILVQIKVYKEGKYIGDKPIDQ